MIIDENSHRIAATAAGMCADLMSFAALHAEDLYFGSHMLLVQDKPLELWVMLTMQLPIQCP